MTGPIPPEIRGKLRGMLWRARLVAVVRGLAVLLGTLLTAVLLAVAIDQHVLGHVERYVILYEWPMRLAVAGIIVLTCSVVAGLTLLRPLMRAYSAAGIARTIEQANPELEERLSSTVELLTSRDPEALRGSETMIRALSSQAVSRARDLSLRGVIRWDRTARYWAVTLLLLLLAAVLAMRWPDAFAASLKRLVLANLERVGSVELVVAGQADRVVPAGEPVMIEAAVRGGQTKRVWLLLRSEDDRLRTVEMAAVRGEPSVFTHTIARAEGHWRYQVRTLDSHTRWHELRAVPRPLVVGISAEVTPPAYSKRPLRRLATLPPTVRVLRQSQIVLRVRTNKCVQRAVLDFEGGQTRDLSDGAEADLLTAGLTAMADTSFRVLLVDEHGLDNLSPDRFRLKVVRDRPPAVSILRPGRRVTLKPADELPIRFRARDDLGLSRAELVVVDGVGDPVVLPIELAKEGARRVESRTLLDLSTLRLEGVKRLAYRLSVADTLPANLGNGPQTAVSAEHEIEIDQGAQSFKMQLLKNVRKEFEGALTKLGTLLEAAEKDVAALHTAATKKQAWTDKEAETSTAVRGTLREAEELTQQVEQMCDYTDYRKLGERLAMEVGQRHIAPAERLIVQAELSADDVPERTDRLGRATYEIERARKRLAELARQFDDAAAYQETAQAMAEAADRQAELAERMRAMGTDELPEGVLQPTSMPTTQTDAMQPGAEPPPSSLGRPTTAPAGKTVQPGKVAPEAMAKLTDEQRELMESIQQMVASNPDLMRPVLDVQQSQGKTLLEQLAELVQRERELLSYAEEQQSRDALEVSRERLGKSQEALAAKTEALAKQRAGMLEAAKASLPDRPSLERPAGRIRRERLDEATKDLAGHVKSLAEAADRVEAHAKALAKQIPDATPHEKRADALRAMSQEAQKLAKRQRDLVGEGKQLAQQREATAKRQAKAQAELTAKGKTLAQARDELAGRVERTMKATAAEARLKSLTQSAPARQVGQGLANAGKQLAASKADQAAASLQHAEAGLKALGTAAAKQAEQAHQAVERHARAIKAWQTEEDQRQAAVKAYHDETARRAKALKAWASAEKQRQAALAKWRAEHPTPKPTTQAATSKPTTSNPATSQPSAVAAAPQPPKELASPKPRPAFKPLKPPASKPKERPKPPASLWKAEQIKTARVAGASFAELAKQAEALSKSSSSLAQAVSAQQQAEQKAGESQAARDRQAAGHQQELIQQTRKLTSRASKALSPDKPLAEAADPMPPMRRAEDELKAGRPTAAVDQEMQAAARLDDLSRRLAEATQVEQQRVARTKSEAQKTREQIGRAQDTARQIARLQQEEGALHKSSQQMARRVKPLGPVLRDKLVADLSRQQTELAKEAAQLSDELSTPSQRDGMVLPAEPNPRAQEAAIRAMQAAEALRVHAEGDKPAASLSSKAPARATTLARQGAAADALTRLAAELQRPVETDPMRWEAQAVEDYLRVRHAERALDLAEDQRRLRRELAETLDGHPARAVGLEQERLADEVTGFALAADFMVEQIEMMGDRVAGLKPKVLASVKQAAELLRKSAPETMRRAAAELKADRAGRAVGPMKAAAKSVQQAQRILSSLQGRLASAAKRVKPGPGDRQALDRQLVEALQDQYDALRRMMEAEQATSDPSTDPAEALARAMREKLTARAAQSSAQASAARMHASAKDFLQAAWELAGQGRINPDEAMIMPTPAMGEGNWRVFALDETVLDLEALGLSRSDWARLPGTLREDVIQAAEDKAPPGYRELIRSYFRAISRQAAARDAKPLVGQEQTTDDADRPAK